MAAGRREWESTYAWDREDRDPEHQLAFGGVLSFDELLALGRELTRELDAGFGATAFHWAEGKPLEDVLVETAMAPGDFVRTCKQVLDLLRQIMDRTRIVNLSDPQFAPDGKSVVVRVNDRGPFARAGAIKSRGE